MSTSRARTQPRKRPAGRYHHGDLGEAILAIARERIAADGVEAFSLRDVSRALRVSEAAAYHHFRGRDDVLARLAERGYVAVRAAMAEAIDEAGDDRWARLLAVGRAYVRFALDDPGTFRAMYGPHMVALARDPDLFAAGRALWELYMAVAAACVKGGDADARQVARTGWAMAHGLAVLLIGREIRPEEDPTPVDELIDGAIATFVAGVRAGFAGDRRGGVRRTRTRSAR